MHFGESWLDSEKKILSEKYGKIPKSELMKLVPNRTWRTIMERARKLGVNGYCKTGKNLYEINGETTIIFLDLRNGKTMRCLISTIDLEKILAFGKWRSDLKVKTKSFYARSKNAYMHRIITGAQEGQEVDHKDYDTLNNTRENLRVVSKSVNMQNRNPANINSKSGLRNVYWHKTLKLWVIKIKVKDKTIVKYSQSLQVAEQIAISLRAELHI